MRSFINKLFRSKKVDDPLPVSGQDSPEIPSPSSPPDLSSVDQTGSVDSFLPQAVAPTLIFGSAQSAGMQRDHNEDALSILTAHLAVGDQTTNFGLFIVADGMGGHENGEIASQLAVEILSSHVVTNILIPLLSGKSLSVDQSIQEILQAGISQAHDTVSNETQGGGTTLTSALILGNQLTIAHVGDSRAYLISSGQELNLLTRDHTLVKRLQEIGQITAEETLIHPHRNVLYRSLGQGEALPADVASYQIQPGDQLLLCTDGLWGVVTDQDLENALSTPHNPQDVCHALVSAANSEGGPDNISTILVYIRG